MTSRRRASLLAALAWSLTLGMPGLPAVPGLPGLASLHVLRAASAAAADVSPALAQLKSDTWQKRSAGFDALVAAGAAEAQRKAVKPALTALMAAQPQQADAIKTGLIAALEQENAIVRKGGSLPEAFTDYYGDLILAVSMLNDVRAIKALTGALGTGSMATSALVAFGEPAVEPVLVHVSQAADGPARRGGCLVLQRWTEPASAGAIKNAALLERVKQALAGPACAKKG